MINAVSGRKVVLVRRTHASPYVDVDKRYADGLVMLYGENNMMRAELLEKYSVDYLYVDFYLTNYPMIVNLGFKDYLEENGIVFATYPFADGQKTGVYCDQRENRWNIAMLARNKRILDLCCYHGGFSLTAIAQGGAAAAVGVDSSPDAIAVCQMNADLNKCTDQVSFVRADIAEFLQQQYQQEAVLLK